MKVTGMNSADLVGALYDSTTQSSNKKKDSNSIENLLSSNMTSNNPAMAKLARKAGNKESYKKALSAAEQTDELLRKLNDAKKSVFVKAADTQDEQAVEDTAYFRMRSRIAELLSVLEPLDAQVLTLRFGLEGDLPMDLEQTGKRLGLTPGEVTARETAALEKLRGEA